MSSVAIGLNHFQAMLFFALIVSAAFAFLTKRGFAERAKYALWAFLTFLLVAIGIGWILYPFSR